LEFAIFKASVNKKINTQDIFDYIFNSTMYYIFKMLRHLILFIAKTFCLASINSYCQMLGLTLGASGKVT
jgi:hypothetical protein